MNVAIFGAFGKRALAAGWTKETAISVFGAGELDLSDAPPGKAARLRAIAILGAIKIQVAPGSRVTMGGFSFFGSREAKVTPGQGPELRVTAVVIFGAVEIKEKALSPPDH